MPAWVGRTAENNRKNNANGQARNAKAACPFIFERFRKKSPGTSPGYDGAARLGTLDSHRKTQSKNTNRNKKTKYSKKDANGGPFGLILQKETTPQKPRWPGTKTALRGGPAVGCPVPGGARPGDAFHCVEHRFGVYYTLYWCGQQPEPGAAPHGRSRKRQRHGEQGKPSRKDGLYEDPAGE